MLEISWWLEIGEKILKIHLKNIPGAPMKALTQCSEGSRSSTDRLKFLTGNSHNVHMFYISVDKVGSQLCPCVLLILDIVIPPNIVQDTCQHTVKLLLKIKWRFKSQNKRRAICNTLPLAFFIVGWWIRGLWNSVMSDPIKIIIQWLIIILGMFAIWVESYKAELIFKGCIFIFCQYI